MRFPRREPAAAARFPRPRGDGPFRSASNRDWDSGFPAHAGMDPDTRGGRAHPGLWFPRPRGDGPHGLWSRRDAIAVSPPTRGWTLESVLLMDRIRTRVSPPTRGWTAIRRYPDPRPRRRWRAYPVSPPTRGWTLATRHGRFGPPIGFPRPRGDGPHDVPMARGRRTSGFPAHAGMDPAQQSGSVGFPAHAGMDGMTRRVSPPTRGWTPSPDCFPAHRCDLIRRFPRPRGDGPVHLLGRSMVLAGFPAHAGMDPSYRWAPALDHGAGFPAHAGMDPIQWPARRDRRGFPRPRGDGPRTSRRRVELRPPVSPPTRGWTPARDGFPAHAGMDLIWGVTLSPEGFPRPRGDGPKLPADRYRRRRCCRMVSPPTRGWTHRRSAPCAADARRPVSPPTRGWTLSTLLAERPGRLRRFPRPRGDGPPGRVRRFHAGPIRRHRRDWFPRPRGDGPSSITSTRDAGRSTSRMVSPPTRGWTGSGDRLGRPEAPGFPAHAGMDPVRGSGR